LTYRWFGHHEGDPGTSYRTKEEIAAWRKKDPIARLRERAIAESWATEADFKDADNEINRVIQEAATFAVADPQPEISTALEHVFSN
jgi:TPP-dependent pyruvate/acetoin dehydrogenase alpha subunit